VNVCYTLYLAKSTFGSVDGSLEKDNRRRRKLEI